MKKRNSYIELLKIVAILLIILSHVVPYGTYKNFSGFVNIDYLKLSLENFVITLFRYGGSLGNCIFIVCSAYFLLDNYKVSLSKILKIVFDSFFISVVSLIAYILIFGNDIGNKEILKFFIPILSTFNWFTTCYLIFYAVHVFLNYIIDSIDKKVHFIIVVLVILFYGFIGMIKSEVLYYNELLGFCSIYFIVSYLKKYCEEFNKNKKKNIVYLLIGIFILFINVLLLLLLEGKFSFTNGIVLSCNKFINPIIILISICLLNLCNQKYFYSSKLNFISSLSLLIYFFQNQIVIGYLKGKIYTYYVNSELHISIISFILLLFVLYLIFCVVSSIIYRKTFGKITGDISNKISDLICKMWNNKEKRVN